MTTVVIIKPYEMRKLLQTFEAASIGYDRMSNALASEVSDADVIRKIVNDWVLYHLREDRS